MRNALFASIALLSACSGSDDNAQQNALPGGIYRGNGTVEVNPPSLFGIIDEHGVARFLHTINPPTSNTPSVISPTSISLSGNSFSTPYVEFLEPQNDTTNGTATGTVTSRSGIVVTLSGGTGNTSTYDLAFQSSSYNVPASFATLAGTWSFSYGNPAVAGQMVFNATGTLSGTDAAGCNYSGSLAIPAPAFNAYDVSLTSSCIEGPLTGLAAFFPQTATQSPSILFIVSGVNAALGLNLQLVNAGPS